MAPPKKNGNLSRSAQYYRDHPEARKKKAETDKKINSRPEQRKKRSELVTERRKRGILGKSNGNDDMSHEGGRIVKRSASSNRGNKSNTQGDRNARG